MGLTLKSAYVPYDLNDGTRYLTETLWPEGVDTQFLSPYQWLHELAPSYYLNLLASWKKWTPAQYRKEYEKQLHKPQGRFFFDRVVQEARDGRVTLLHRSRKHANHIQPDDTTVYYLKEFLDAELSKPYSTPTATASIFSPASPQFTRDSNRKERDKKSKKDKKDSEITDPWSNEGGKVN